MTNKLSERFTKEYIAEIGIDIKEYYSDEHTEVKLKNGFTLGDAIKQDRRNKGDRNRT